MGGQSDRDDEIYRADGAERCVQQTAPSCRKRSSVRFCRSSAVDNLDEAIEFIRDGDKPLAALHFHRSDAAAETRFVDEVSCGSTCINDTMMFMMVHELPFGGVGASGMGAYSGEHGFNTFSHMKAVMKRGWWPDVALRYAPYTEKKFDWMRKLLARRRILCDTARAQSCVSLCCVSKRSRLVLTMPDVKRVFFE